MHPVGADQHVAGDMLAVGQTSVTPSVVCSKPTQPLPVRIASGGRLPDGVEQDFMEVAAMHHPIGRPEPFDRGFAEVEDSASSARSCRGGSPCGRGADDVLHRRREGRARSGCVCRLRRAARRRRPLAVRCLLEDPYVAAFLDQGEGHGQATQTSTGNQHTRLQGSAPAPNRYSADIRRIRGTGTIPACRPSGRRGAGRSAVLMARKLVGTRPKCLHPVNQAMEMRP